MVGHHLAQLNVAKLAAPLESVVMAGFVGALDAINSLADSSPGFVWRLQTDEGNATAIRPFEDEMMAVNLSMWVDLESLRAFVYAGDHREILRRRNEWFLPMAEPHLVMWWVEAGHTPSIEEAMERLEVLRRNGPTSEAFTFGQAHSPPGQADREDIV